MKIKMIKCFAQLRSLFAFIVDFEPIDFDSLFYISEVNMKQKAKSDRD